MNSFYFNDKKIIKKKGDKLYFAGEATIYQYTGTVHGAYESGVQCATSIIESISNNSSDDTD